MASQGFNVGNAPFDIRSELGDVTSGTYVMMNKSTFRLFVYTTDEADAPDLTDEAVIRGEQFIEANKAGTLTIDSSKYHWCYYKVGDGVVAFEEQ